MHTVVLIMYLNNVLSFCIHIICIMEKTRWARIVDMCRYRILFNFRIHCWIFRKKVYGGPRPLAYSLYAFINVDNCERPLIDLWFVFGAGPKEVLSYMLCVKRLAGLSRRTVSVVASNMSTGLKLLR